MKSNRYSSENRAANILERLKNSAAGKKKEVFDKLMRPKDVGSELSAQISAGSSVPDQYISSHPYTIPDAIAAGDKEQSKPDASNIKSNEKFQPPALPDTLLGREQRLRTLLLDMQQKGGFEEIVLVDSTGLSLVGSSDGSTRGTLAAVTVLLIESLSNSVKYIAKEPPLFASVSLESGRFFSIRGLKCREETYYIAAISRQVTSFEAFEKYMDAFIDEIAGGSRA